MPSVFAATLQNDRLSHSGRISAFDKANHLKLLIAFVAWLLSCTAHAGSRRTQAAAVLERDSYSLRLALTDRVTRLYTVYSSTLSSMPREFEKIFETTKSGSST